MNDAISVVEAIADAFFEREERVQLWEYHRLYECAVWRLGEVRVRCRCGWVIAFDAKTLERALSMGRESAFDLLEKMLGEPIRKHLDDEWHKFHPTLAEFTDWGWFCEAV